MINIGENIVEGEKIFLRYFFGASISCICVYTLVDEYQGKGYASFVKLGCGVGKCKNLKERM